jgi:hypothetical protein
LFDETTVPADLTIDLSAEIIAEHDARDDEAELTEASLEAADALSDAVALVDTYDIEAQNNPTSAAFVAAEGDVETAQEDIDTLTDALALLVEAQGNSADLKASDDAITAAEKTFTDNDFVVPVTVDGAEQATADADIFLAGTTAGAFSIADFALSGGDVLFVDGAVYNDTVIGTGTDETLLTKAGDDAVIEFFLEETGAGVDVIVETKAFGSSATDAEVVIELTGVSLAEVTVTDGFISIA